jgi:hypothetical protein
MALDGRIFHFTLAATIRLPFDVFPKALKIERDKIKEN